MPDGSGFFRPGPIRGPLIMSESPRQCRILGNLAVWALIAGAETLPNEPRS